MKRLASALVLGALLIVGCEETKAPEPIAPPTFSQSISPTPSPSVSAKPMPTKKPKPPAATSRDVYQTYLDTVKGGISNPERFDNEIYLKMAATACDSADAGESYFTTVDRIEGNGLTETDAAFVVGAAWAAFCPEHTKRLIPR